MEPAPRDEERDPTRAAGPGTNVSQPGAACLSEGAVQRAAQDEMLTLEESRHVAACAWCIERVRAAREDSAFLTRARSLVADGLGPVSSPRLSGYRMIEVLSSGSQGVVYKAIQESTTRTVAIKTHAPGEPFSERQRARAEREAEIAARLHHLNVVTIFESQVLADGRVAVVMEFVDGVALDDWAPPGRTAGQRQRALLAAFAAVCAGVHHAHLNGVIHRDLKPANILVTRDGRPVVVDFGVAKVGGIGATITGGFMGTPAYASPEQSVGAPAEVDALTDVYSLGVILYKLLCGTLPYDLDGSLRDVARTIAETEPTPPRHVQPALSPDLESITLRALSKQKERRYQSAEALARDIERYLRGEPVEARSNSGWYLLRKAVVMNRRLLGLATAILVILAAAGAAVAVSMTRAASEAKLAALQREQARAENLRARAVAEILRQFTSAIPADALMQHSLIGEGLNRLYDRLEAGSYADDPELDLELRLLWGGMYTDYGAESFAEMAAFSELALRTGLMQVRSKSPDPDPRTASLLHRLASVLLHRRRYTEAEQYARQATEMQAKLFGASSVPNAESRTLLAQVLVRLGKVDEAAAEAHAALHALSLDGNGSQDLLKATLNSLLGRIELASGRDGEEFIRAALLEQLRRLPPSAPELLETLRDLATLAERHPDSTIVKGCCAGWTVLDAALPEAIRLDIQLIRSRDKSVAGCSAALGRLLSFQERLEGNPDAVSVDLLLARKHAAVSEELFGDAEVSMSRAAELVALRFGEKSFPVVMCLNQVLSFKDYDGRTNDEAVALARRICDIIDSVQPHARDPVSAASQRRIVAVILTLSRQFEEAIPEWDSAIAQYVTAIGAEHYYVCLCKAGLAFCLIEVGRVEEADRITEEAADQADRTSEMPANQRAAVLMSRGHVLCKLGRHTDARPVLERAWELWYKTAPPPESERQTLLRDLAAACDKTGDTQAATKWRGYMNANTPRVP